MQPLFNTLCLFLSSSEMKKENTHTHRGKRKRLLNDTGWKGVREPLYIYGLCRTGGSGVVKWSRAPKPSLNSKYRQTVESEATRKKQGGSDLKH